MYSNHCQEERNRTQPEASRCKYNYSPWLFTYVFKKQILSLNSLIIYPPPMQKLRSPRSFIFLFAALPSRPCSGRKEAALHRQMDPGVSGKETKKNTARFVFFSGRIWRDLRRGLMYSNHCQEVLALRIQPSAS